MKPGNLYYTALTLLITLALAFQPTQSTFAGQKNEKIEDHDQESNSEPGEANNPSEGYYCSQTEIPHPFGARLAERYSMEYAVLQAWFCEGFGWGQIMLALQTGQLTGNDAESFLNARSNGQGWGQIWKELGLIGRPEDAGPPDGKGPNKDKNKDHPKDKKPRPEKENPNNRP